MIKPDHAEPGPSAPVPVSSSVLPPRSAALIVDKASPEEEELVLSDWSDDNCEGSSLSSNIENNASLAAAKKVEALKAPQGGCNFRPQENRSHPRIAGTTSGHLSELQGRPPLQNVRKSSEFVGANGQAAKRRSSALNISGLDAGTAECDGGILKNRPKSSKIDSGIPGFPSLANTAVQYLARVKEVYDYNVYRIFDDIRKKDFKLSIETFRSNTQLEIGTRIRLFEPKLVDSETLAITNDNGVMIVEPMTLVSSTTLVQALFCKRKAVFTEKFRSSGTNIQMTLGNVCHDLFQQALRRRPKVISDTWFLADFRNHILPKLALDLLALDVSATDFEAQLRPYLSNITKWMRDHMPGPLGNAKPLVDGTVIDDIEDIEMNIWSAGIGVKGKIDVAIRNTHGRVIPLELKTGKSNANKDHHAQVLMYIAMMSELSDGYLDPGLLLYLKDGTSRPVKPGPYELKDILATRNGMAGFAGHLTLDAFPDPLPDTRFCDKCQYETHCTVIQQLAPPKNVTTVMANYAKEKTNHLKAEDLEYARNWLKWAFQEWAISSKRHSNKSIFDLSAVEREQNGTTITNLTLANVEKANKMSPHSSFLLEFRRRDRSPLPASVLELSDVVTISTAEAIAVQSGVVNERTDNSIIVKADKELGKRLRDNRNNVYTLDKYESSSSYSMNLNSVIAITTNTPSAARLREAVIALKPPSRRTMPAVELESISSSTATLSETQKGAIIAALTAEEYALIQGFPGSGKTSTIVALVQYLVALGKSVLITAYTNSAVDNMLLRLRKVVPEEKLLRIGGNASTSRHPEMGQMTLDSRIGQLKGSKNLVGDARALLKSFPVVGTTCLTAGNHSYFEWRPKFDYVIVDEAALCLQSAIIKPLLLGHRFVLVGDPCQLEPLVISTEAKEAGMAVSLMERLEPVAAQANCLVRLNEQYRMNDQICALSSDLFYDGLLRCANETIANQVIDHMGIEKENLPPNFLPDDLLKLLLSQNKSDSVIFIDTQSRGIGSSVFEKAQSTTASKSNRGEVELIAKMCKVFTLAEVPASSIGTMSTYRSQVEELRKLVPLGIETNTVDQYQGRDKDVILVSFVHTSDSGDDSKMGGGILSERRLNVALTRAKKKLILVGCVESLKQFEVMSKLLGKVGCIYKYSSF
uniref:DNA replication ATP-dependent helicase/nuclease n=1 Tax=Panagrellus redivivus TaxID=6233 RepID=A0A7E4ZZ34_PANRE